MKTWLINTNSNPDNGNPNGFQIMLRQNKVSAFYDRKDTVNGISEGDLILLYHNQNRIIAVGYALKLVEQDFGDITEVEHAVDVNWFWKADFRENGDGTLLPTNYIDRHILGFTSVRRTVENITNQINHFNLLVEIGKRQNYV